MSSLIIVIDRMYSCITFTLSIKSMVKKYMMILARFTKGKIASATYENQALDAGQLIKRSVFYYIHVISSACIFSKHSEISLRLTEGTVRLMLANF